MNPAVAPRGAAIVNMTIPGASKAARGYESVSQRRIRIRREQQQAEARKKAANQSDDAQLVQAQPGGSQISGPGPAGPATLSESKKMTKIEDIEAVKRTVEAMKSGGGSAHYLMPVYEWQDQMNGGKRADSATRKLDGFHILCPTNTLVYIGVRVCSSYLTGTCHLEKPVFLFSSALGGTKSFENHTNGHGVTKASLVAASPPRAQKTVLSDAAARACVMSQFNWRRESFPFVH